MVFLLQRTSLNMSACGGVFLGKASLNISAFVGDSSCHFFSLTYNCYRNYFTFYVVKIGENSQLQAEHSGKIRRPQRVSISNCESTIMNHKTTIILQVAESKNKIDGFDIFLMAFKAYTPF